MKITAARQKNSVSEGMALALTLRGVSDIPFDKVKVDLAFEHAWRGWSFASRFPRVNVGPGSTGPDASYVLIHADEQTRTLVLFWDLEGNSLSIYCRLPDWAPDNAEDIGFAVRMLDGDVPLEGWLELGDAFLARLGLMTSSA